MGVLFSRKRYALRKYLFVLLIVIGVAVFMYKDDVVKEPAGTEGLGEVLLVSTHSRALLGNGDFGK